MIPLDQRILCLRKFVAAHSYLYYILGIQAISDAKWQEAAEELHVLHKRHPEYTDPFDKWWEDWDPMTGYGLLGIPGLESLSRHYI